MCGKKKQSDSPFVLCIQPPVYDFALYDLFFTPYGLFRIMSWLEKSGYRTEFLNALDFDDPETVTALGPVKRKSDGTGKFHRIRVDLPLHVRRIRRRYGRYGILPGVLERRIRESRPDLVLITSQMTYWYQGVGETVGLVKKYHPGVPVVVGGVYASLLPDHCREKTGADHVVIGDGFAALPGILEQYGFPVPELSVEEASLHQLSDEARKNEGARKDSGVIRLNTGCPYRCRYCASGLLEPRFLPGDPDILLDVIREMHEGLGIRNFAFYDDALLVHKERVLQPLLEGVIRLKLHLRFYTPNAVHMHHMDQETAELMKRAGFQEVRLGYESADDEFHRDLDTKYSPGEVPLAISSLKKAGFTGEQILLYVLAGLPRQPVTDVEKTLAEAEHFGVRVSIAEYSPVPRTALWKEAVDASYLPLEGEPLYHNNTFFPMEWEGFSREDLERVKFMARSMGTAGRTAGGSLF